MFSKREHQISMSIANSLLNNHIAQLLEQDNSLDLTEASFDLSEIYCDFYNDAMTKVNGAFPDDFESD